MKAAELLSFLVAPMKAMSDVGIRMEDYKHEKLWSDYLDMLRAGYKKAYIYAVLAHRYGISERSVVRLIKRFESEV